MNSVSLQNGTNLGQDPVLHFYFEHTFDMTNAKKYDFNERLYSPYFKTVHDGIGLEWRNFIRPQGGRTRSGVEYPKTTGLYLQFLPKPGLVENVIAKYHFFEESSNKAGFVSLFVARNPMTFLNEKNKESNGRPDVIPVGVDRSSLKIGLQLTIAEKYFDVSHNFHGAVLNRKFDFSGLLEDVQTTAVKLIEVESFESETVSETQRPASDRLKVLDFNIFCGSDWKIIWCHRSILGKKNEYFRTVMTTEVGENKNDRTTVTFDSDTMMEIVHFIYTDALSEKFTMSNIQNVVLAADFFGVIGMKSAIEQKLIHQIAIKNALEIVSVAHSCDFRVLKERALNFASENVRTVRTTKFAEELPGTLWDAVYETLEKRFRASKMPMFCVYDH